MNDDVIPLPYGDFRVAGQGEPVTAPSQPRLLRPGVTVVVPNRNRAADPGAALQSLCDDEAESTPP